MCADENLTQHFPFQPSTVIFYSRSSKLLLMLKEKKKFKMQ